MEEFDEDDFSDLYADVEVQASSAISAMHRSTELPPRSASIVATAARGADIGTRHGKCDERDAACEVKEDDRGGGGSTNSPVENRDRCGSRSVSECESESESESEGESEDALNSGGDDDTERKFYENCDSEKCDDLESDVEIGETAGKEKSLNAGEYASQGKYDSLNSKKNRVDEMAQEMRRTCKKENSDERDPIFHRASADKHPNYGLKHGGLRRSSDRHTQACYPMSLDLDKHGSVQISDSVEDSSRDVSECESEGISESPHDPKRRQASCIYNKVSSTIEPESSESGRSEHGRGYSCYPRRAAPSSRYCGKSRKRSRYSPSSFQCKFQEPITHGNHPPKDSESRGVKQGTGSGRYHERWRDSMRGHSNQLKKSNHIPYFKNRPDDDSYVFGASHLYDNRHASRGKPRAMVAFNYNANNIPYCSQPERILTDSGGHMPDHRLEPQFYNDQYWDLSNCRYKSGRSDGHNVSWRHDVLDHKTNQMDYEAFEHNRYHNQRRHSFKGEIEGLRNSAPKYSSIVKQRGIQLMCTGDSMHHRRRTRRECLSPRHEYDDRFAEGKYRRNSPHRGRDNLDLSYDRNVAFDCRESDSSGRDTRRPHSSLKSFENLSYIHRPFPLYSSDKPYASSREEFLGAPGQNSGVAQRNIRCSWKEMRFECDQYGTDVATSVARKGVRCHPYDYNIRRKNYKQSSNTSVMRDCIKDDQYQDDFVGRRYHQYSEVLHSREDAFKPRQQDSNDYGCEEPSYHFKRISKNKKADDRLAFCRVTELNERELIRENSNMLRDNSQYFDGFRESTQHHSHAQMQPSHQDSVDHLVVVCRKSILQSSIRRTTEAGEDTFYGRRGLMEWNEETNCVEEMDASNPEKTFPVDVRMVNSSLSNKSQQRKISNDQQDEFLDIEEGQIISEEIQKATKCINVTVHPETAPDGSGIAEKLDDEKIREIMMKMERRRERFKEPTTASRDCEKTSCSLPESNVEAAEARLERPARKRRWLGT